MINLLMTGGQPYSIVRVAFRNRVQLLCCRVGSALWLVFVRSSEQLL